MALDQHDFDLVEDIYKAVKTQGRYLKRIAEALENIAEKRGNPCQGKRQQADAKKP